jgi:signal peptidase I
MKWSCGIESVLPPTSKSVTFAERDLTISAPIVLKHSQNMSKSTTAAADTPVELHQRIRTEGSRETVESIVVAIILALLFRAFVAEAFVIPTGSMAPALMGAHKDLVCPQCDQPYQVGASRETARQPQETTVVGSVCPNCRHLNPLDLANAPNDQTFAGDRILVSKFAYALSDPERWDVIVFKYPGNPKQNYIKRLVGLPRETLQIRYGDVFARPEGGEAFEILRKPHEKLMAMSHTVSDTGYQADALVAAGYPSNWQPWQIGATTPPTDGWIVDRQAKTWTATLANPTAEPKYLRYFHRWPDDQQWEQAEAGLSLANIDPYSSLAITDFYPYDAYLNVDTDRVYNRPPGLIPSDANFFSKAWYRFFPPGGEFRSSYVSGGKLDQFDNQMFLERADTSRMGSHWVGDLIVEADVQAQGEGGEIILELVESAVQFRCRIDLATGVAKFEIIDLDGPVTFAEAGGKATSNPTAETKVRAGTAYQLRMANCDDSLYLWVNGSPVEFDQPTTYDMAALRTLAEQHPYATPEHPFDAAPVAIAAAGTELTVSRLQVLRDKYYIAVDRQVTNAFNDYNVSGLTFSLRGQSDGIQDTLKDPQQWDQSPLWNARRTVQFDLEADQFFPMGDNSPESEDARCWVRRSLDPYTGRPVVAPAVDPDAYYWSTAAYVPRDLLVGKALMVFWPHTWNTPVPFTPNFKRFSFIR